MKKQTSLIGKIPLLSFFIEARDEIKKVTWPTRQQIIRLSAIVIIASLATGLYLGALDYIFTELLALIINN